MRPAKRPRPRLLLGLTLSRQGGCGSRTGWTGGETGGRHRLAGGASRRMGQVKALVDFGGQPLVLWMCTRLSQGGWHPVFVAAGASLSGRLRSLGLQVVRDRFEARGPLAGLHAGLAAASPGLHAVLSCDQPFFDSEALGYLLSRARSERVDVCVPRVGRRLQVLHAIYDGSLAGVTERMLSTGESAVYRLLDHVRWQAVEEEEMKAFGDPSRLFFNVNTPEDLAVARSWVQAPGRAGEQGGCGRGR